MPAPGTARIPNGVGCAGFPRSLFPDPATCIVCTLRDGWAGSLTPSDSRSGLGGPMPTTITLVVVGRCRPSPDRVPESASPNRDTGGIVTGHLSCLAGQGLGPVLGSPHRRVSRIDGDDREAVFGGHGDEPGFELAGRDAGDELPEPLAAPVLLAGLLGGEVQVFQPDGLHPAPVGPVQQLDDGVPDLGISVISRAGEVVEEPARVTDRVAVWVEVVGGEVVGVGVHTDHAVSAGGVQRDRLDDGPLPGGRQVPASASTWTWNADASEGLSRVRALHRAHSRDAWP